MRVQPLFPSSPLLATVMSRLGFALWACSAANSPAPPAPRIRISVLRRSTCISKRTGEENKGDQRRGSGGDGRKLFLSAMPIEILDDENAQAPEHVHDEKENQRAFGKLHQRLVGPAQKRIELRRAVKRKAEREEMQRQKDCQSKTRKPVHKRRPPQGAVAVMQSKHHASTTAATARIPSNSSRNPKTTASMPAARSPTGDHSAKTLRRPM